MGRMSRFGRVLAVVLVAAAAAMLSGTGVASADEAPNTQTRMRDYSDGEVWATRWTWARARHRVGFEWTTAEPYQVRAVAQLQVDWPTGCTAGADLSGPSIDGCDPKLVLKGAAIDFREINIPLRWNGPDGGGQKTCRWTKTGTEIQDFNETWTCTGEWMRQQDYFQYSMSTADLTADVKNDGDGLRDLPALADTLTFVQP
jgi:hypothetical protein